SYEAFHGLSLVVQLIPAVGIIAFAAWGLGPLLRKNDNSWAKSKEHQVMTSYIQPLLLWGGVVLICRQLEDQENVTDPVARLRMQSSTLRSVAFDGGVSNREAGIRNLSQPRGSPDVSVVPIRISTLPPGLASSKLICSSVSVVYLVLARAQHADSSNVSGSHARSAENRPPEASEIHEIPSSLDQLLRNLFPGEPNHCYDFIF
nr:mechanosensitive ion channel protein 2, chloroplastic-like isoform X1 [Tanacetum cinerariifolium]